LARGLCGSAGDGRSHDLGGCGPFASGSIENDWRERGAALRSKDVGVIEAGRRADLVLLGANPLEKIGNTRSIRWVTQAGNRVSDRPPTIL
jgi:hypothetical protein